MIGDLAIRFVKVRLASARILLCRLSAKKTARSYRWGFLSTANVARTRSRYAQASGQSLYSVASRNRAKANSFARAYGFERTHASYEDLVEDPAVEAVYICLPSALHLSLIQKATPGKVILCEKPVCANMDELLQIEEAIQQRDLKFLDATAFLWNSKLPQLKDSLGSVDAVAYDFHLGKSAGWMASNIRCNPTLEPLGCLGDLGWYGIRWALYLLERPPTEVQLLDSTVADGALVGVSFRSQAHS